MRPERPLASPVVSRRGLVGCALAIAWLGGPVVGCTDAGLLPVVDEPVLGAADDRLTLVGEVCTAASEDVVFPVKVLFVIDTSGSMQQTDPNNRRATAVEEVVAHYRNNPGVQFGIISFRESVNDLTQGFTRDGALLAQAVEGLRLADSLTDYQGALGMAYTVLQQDMLRAGAAERARSKYVVVFLSDGTPQPQCHRATPCVTTADCGNVFSQCEEGFCTDPFLVCQVDRDDWAGIQVPESLYPEMEAGSDYNQPYQILRWIDDMRALATRYAVGDLRVHTGFLYDPNLSEAWRQAFGIDREAGERLLSDMALHGAGTYSNFYSGDAITFLDVDYTAIRRDFVLRALFATNGSVLPASGRAAVDSDGDGLGDDAEFALGTDALSGDSDGDGYNDTLEARATTSGFDPLDPARPHPACAPEDRFDRDGDGLNDCEERFAGSDRTLFDSDRDGLPDGLELLARLEPLVAEGNRDLDGDGRINSDELRQHTDPFRADAAAARGEAYEARLEPLGIEGAGRHCYAFTLSNVRLDQTLAGGLDRRAGINVVRLHFVSALEDDPNDPGVLTSACALARWVKPYYREPLDGVMTIERDDFKPAAELRVPDDCVGVAVEAPEPPAPEADTTP